MENFRVETDVVPGTVFYSWVFGFGGKVVINGPAEVKEQYKEMVLKAAGLFIGAEKNYDDRRFFRFYFGQP